METTGCMCNHLTAFGGFYVAPNPLPTPSLALLKEGYVLLVVVGSVLLLYVVGLLFARRADRRDATKVLILTVFVFIKHQILFILIFNKILFHNT